MFKKSFLNSSKKFLSPILKDKKILFSTVIFFFSDAIISIILIYLFKIILDNTGNINIISRDFYIFLFFVFIKFFIIIYFRNFSGTFYPELRKILYKEYLQKYLSLDNTSIEKYGTGKIITILDKSTNIWVEQLHTFFRDGFLGILNLIFSLCIIFVINFYYGLVISFLIILGFFITFLTSKLTSKYRLPRRDNNILITRRILNFINSKFEILQNNKGSLEINKIIEALNVNVYLNKKMSDIGTILIMFVNIIVYGSRIFVLYLFIKGFANGQLTIGELMILVSFIALLEGILKILQELYFSFNKNMVDIVKIWDFFDNENKKIVSYDTGKNFIFKSGNISIKDLTFSYGDKNIFENLDLEISGSKKIAFVGNSGAGKTTLLKLISGFISPNSGEIFIDGQNLSDVNLVSYYKNIGYLTQEPSVFDGTILENLMYGVDSSLLTPIPSLSYPQGVSMVPPEEEWDEKNHPSPGRGGIEGGVLHEIIKLSKCDFIYDFKDGLNTEIGERGIRLSGGQKQRLAIAKIMLKNPHIILLDEPTSALDSFSEEQITIALNNLFLGKTVIIIAHRLQTVKNADEIILLENGKVKERGNHNELLEKKGDYFKMVELQSGF